MIKVLLVGPSTTSNGGIASVIKNILNFGKTDKLCFRHITTYDDGSNLYKFFVFIRAFSHR